MKLTVKNLGAVSHAEVDLDKNLLIFTGENNTGKTYLVYSVYQLYNLSNSVSGEAPSPLEGYATVKPEKNFEFNLLDIISDKSEYLSDLQKFISKSMQIQLADFFSTSIDMFANTSIDFQLNKISIQEQDVLAADTLIFGEDDTASKSEGSPNIIFHSNFNEEDENYYDLEKDITDFVKDTVFDLVRDILFNRSFIFPAEREGINLFNKELLLFRNKVFEKLISDRKQKQELTDFMRTRFSRYPEPIRDALNQHNNYDVLKTKTGDFAHLANELEDTFLRGNVQMNTEGDLLFKPKNLNKALDIHLTSSTVKSLSSLIIYLRHKAQKGDLIIIDEPELNLHPDNQRKIARFLGRLINEGFKVIISTHSDYIMRELNNLIMLSHGMQVKKKETQHLLKEYKYNQNELIAAEQVDVHLFRVGQPVENVVVTETGFNIATIDEEIRKLNQSSQDIYLTLFDA